MYLIFDTETTGLPRNKTAPISDLDNWPRLVQLAWQLHDHNGKLINRQNHIIKPYGFDIPYKAEQVHGISTAKALEVGEPIQEVLEAFQLDLQKSTCLVGHNIEFDINIIGSELFRLQANYTLLTGANKIDTADVSIDFCQLPGGPGGKFKMPKLSELHIKLFGKDFGDAHDAAYDVAATGRCFFGLIKASVVKPLGALKIEEIVYEEPVLESANFATKKSEGEKKIETNNDAVVTDKPFFHLHVHSQYSVLQATPEIKKIVAKAKAMNMPAVALTDLGNLYGAFKFVREALDNGIKPILGCEFYVAEERKKLKFTKDNPDKRYNQILFAKNKEGYHNLTKLSSLAFIEGLYGIHPRIDKDLIKQYADGLIATTGSLQSEIPYLILHVGTKQAEEVFAWYQEVFKDDFYIQLNRQRLPEQDHVNKVLLEFAAKYGVKYYAANEVYYLQQEDADAQDILICIKEQELKSTPIGHGRGTRYGLPNQEFYFKSQEEMKQLFRDLPEAIETLSEIESKIETYKLQRNVLLPKFDIPENFSSEDEYLRHLTYEGAKAKYETITPEIQERLDFELETIKKTGYPGYFLIVQDFTNKAREMGVSVGPGRGSAAGSAVAYAIGITNVDPIKYDLLFERFLNPDRVSLPDIDIDFDDEGRDKVLQYVIDKYGKNQVAQIITYGTEAAKSSIRDCARVMELPLNDANALAKLVPERPGTSLEKAFTEVNELKETLNGSDLRAQVLKQAKRVEGAVRNTGTHACGVIITPDDLTNFVPVSTAKDSDMLVTQFDNSVVESAGLLKMDFLGLTTLSIINSAIKNIKKSKGIVIDVDTIPLDDVKTYQLFQRGDTTGTFQFESVGMQKYLRQLKPDKFEDLIAMNALYRPGPMEYIPQFINRKHGREAIQYDLPEMEEYLAETYGITVYQEQVMLLSQKLAGFSKGDADVLRKAMGKKQKEVLDKMKSKFIEGCQKHNHPEEICEKIWKDWEAFAQYAFNKSHSTCYSLVAYHTAYLKANYPAEYMAAVLTHSQSNLENVTFFIEDCKSMGLQVLGPHINESGVYFEVNKQGEIRFGLGAIKGAGDAAVQAIIQERDANGIYQDIFDLTKRLSAKSVTKKTYECLAQSGAFDCFEGIHRRQYVYAREGDTSLIEKAMRYAAKTQQEELSSQVSLFGGGATVALPKPKIETLEPFSEIEKLNLEKEVVGIYISGHPLDNFKFELESFTNLTCQQLNDIEPLLGKEAKVGGIISSVEHRTTKTGKPFGKFTLEDYSGNYTFTLFSEDYLKFRNMLNTGWFVLVEGSIIKNSWGQQTIEMKIRTIELLNELGIKRCKGVQAKVQTHEINAELIHQIELICGKFSGNTPFYLKLRDEQDNISLDMLSRKFRISPVNDMVKELKKWAEVEVVY